MRRSHQPINKRMSRRFILVFLAALVTPCAAESLYGYVDENGVAHWSNLPLEGYILFRKDPPAQQAPAAALRENVHLPAAVLPARYKELAARVAREQQVDVALL